MALSILPSASDGSTERVKALDGLRALAFIAVFLVHVCPSWAPGGGLGVRIFFTLSGYVITMLLLNEFEKGQTLDLRRFYSRRFFRLVPALLVVMGVAVPVLLVQLADNHSYVRETLIGLPFVLTFTGNWYRAESGGIGLGAFAHTWSLGVEWQFYLLWPVAFLGVRRKFGNHGVFILALAGSVVAALLRLMLFRHGLGYGRVRHGTDTLADQLLLGAGAALASRMWPIQVQRMSRILVFPSLIFLAGLIIADPHEAFFETWGMTLVAVCAAIVVSNIVTSPTGVCRTVLSTQPLPTIGLLSYGLYLWHYPVNVFVGNLMTPSLVCTGIVAAITGVMATLSYLLIERPLLRRHHRVILD